MEEHIKRSPIVNVSSPAGEYRCYVKRLFGLLLSLKTDKDVTLSSLALLCSLMRAFGIQVPTSSTCSHSLTGKKYIIFGQRNDIWIFMGSSLIHTKPKKKAFGLRDFSRNVPDS